ncbi:MAG: Ldh family oxidoreductase [Spirochaetes bacterium]|nr:Ldh family oxidoreductase [Spirochaetota bacterium]
MKNDVCLIPLDEMKKFMIDVFKGLEVPENEAKICADVLIEADKRGMDSHGINRLKPIYYDRIKAGIQFARTKIDIIKDNMATAVLDGNDGMGMVVSHKAMNMAIEKAKIYGLGMVAVRNSTHYGIAGYYTSMAVKHNMIGITGTNARPSVAPTFGVQGMLGTNPMTFGIPTDEDFPFSLDCATSISQRGKIEYYARAGKPTPAGLVINHSGESMTDSAEILKALTEGTAALNPVGGIGEDTGGYKGYGYSTVVEILSAALQGGSFLQMLSGFKDGKKAPYHLGHFFIAINIESFSEVNDFKKTSGDILRALRKSKKMPGADRIYTAGEKEHEIWLDRKDTGVPVNASLQEDIKTLINELNITGYQFPFL